MAISVNQNIHVMGADVHTTDVHEQIVITSRSTVGVNTGKSRTRSIGFTISEQVGLAIVNPKGVTSGRKSVIIGK